MFSPITARSLKIRLLYAAIYAALILGALAMIIPFLIMATNSIEPISQGGERIFPTWLTNRPQFWHLYLETKYRDSRDTLRMAWGDPDANYQDAALPDKHDNDVALWKQFVEEVKPGPEFYSPGFLRQNARMPSYTSREFRIWLLRKYGGNLLKLNAELETQFPKITTIQAPVAEIVGPMAIKSKFMEKFLEFCGGQPQSHLIPWNIGGYYRAVFLPRMLGYDIAAYNQKYGTHYASYRDVPFPPQAPIIGQADWLFFVSKVLRPDFVDLTNSGKIALAASGAGREEFIRTLAAPEHLRVVSLDTLFSQWGALHGIADLRIPQRYLDLKDFEKEATFWKWQFLTLNYRYVLDELLLHGRAICNTVILVTLSLAGALIVNPLAAYALSRFKLRQTYFILLFCLATISFPAEVTMIPVFLQMKEFHLLNTFGALVLPSVASGFSIFLLKGFFDSLPKELYEAAELDGASEWMIFWQITMALSKPILAVIALAAFTSAYGAFFYAVILAPNPKMWTIMVNIYQLRITADPPVVYASLILTAIPTLLMFIFCQNLILRGIVVPSEK